MKKAIRKKYYELWSGDEFICQGDVLDDLAKIIGCSRATLVKDKEDTIVNNSWTFDFKKYNYTIKKIINKTYVEI